MILITTTLTILITMITTMMRRRIVTWPGDSRGCRPQGCWSEHLERDQLLVFYLCTYLFLYFCIFYFLFVHLLIFHFLCHARHNTSKTSAVTICVSFFLLIGFHNFLFVYILLLIIRINIFGGKNKCDLINIDFVFSTRAKVVPGSVTVMMCKWEVDTADILYLCVFPICSSSLWMSRASP